MYIRTSLASLLLISSQVAAQESGSPINIPKEQIDFAALDKICVAGSSVPPSDFAKGRIEHAKAEWHLFGDQQIDASGKMVRFGGSEAETNEDKAGTATTNGEAPWRNVSRYWETTWGKKFISGYIPASLKLFSYRDGLSGDASASTGGADEVALQTLMDIVSKHRADDPIAWRAIQDAAIRASIVDVPWSAAFISTVHHDSGMPVTPIGSSKPTSRSFRMAESHVSYISDAFRESSLESLYQQTNLPYNVYRACDPDRTKPRMGDMICYSRDSEVSPTNKVFERYTKLFLPNSAISYSHCDIIVNVDTKALKIDVIGGNVQQSVTMKRLNLRRPGYFSTVQPPDLSSDEQVCPAGLNCRLSKKRWFVLLQER